MSLPTFSTYMYPATRVRMSCLEWIIGNPNKTHFVARLHIKRRFPRDYR